MRSFVTYFLLAIPFGLFAQRGDNDIMGRFNDQGSSIAKSCFSIKTDLLTPPINYLFFNRPTVSLSLEYGFSWRHAIQLTAQYGTFYKKGYPMAVGLLHYDTDLHQTRGELILDYKYYLKDSNDFKRFYCGLYLRAIGYEIRFNTPNSYTSLGPVTLWYIGYGAGLTFGYLVYKWDHLAVDFLLGLGVRNFYFNPVTDFPEDQIPGPLQTPVQIDIRTTVNVGYRF